VQCLSTDWTARFSSLEEVEDFSSSLCVQTSSEAHPVSYTMGTRGTFPGGKVQPGHDADHSPASSAEVKNKQELYSSPPLQLHGTMGQLYFFTLL
jgi:hypothetical protein